jgi:hypothetical protein
MTYILRPFFEGLVIAGHSGVKKVLSTVETPGIQPELGCPTSRT